MDYLDDWHGWRAPLGFVLIAGGLAFAATLRWLPETLMKSAGDMGFASIPRDFAFLIRQRRFNGYAFGLAFTSVTFFSFVAGAPFVTVELLGAAPSDYGLFFMPVVGCYMVSNFLSARITQRFGIDRMITAGMVIVVGGGAGALGASHGRPHDAGDPVRRHGLHGVRPRPVHPQSVRGRGQHRSHPGRRGGRSGGIPADRHRCLGFGDHRHAMMTDSAVPMAVVMFIGALGLLAAHVWGVLTAPPLETADTP